MLTNGTHKIRTGVSIASVVGLITAWWILLRHYFGPGGQAIRIAAPIAIVCGAVLAYNTVTHPLFRRRRLLMWAVVCSPFGVSLTSLLGLLFWSRDTMMIAITLIAISIVLLFAGHVLLVLHFVRARTHESASDREQSTL